MKDLIGIFEEKIEKHEDKLKAHRESEVILKNQYDKFKEDGDLKYERVGEKLLSTIKNIEYHTATSKTYSKVVAMLNSLDK